VYNATNPFGGPTPIVYSNMNPSLPDTSVWNPTYGSDNYASTTYGGCGYTVRNRLQVQISTTNVGATPFRTIARQGGYNGCLVHNQTCNYYTGLCTGQSPNVTLSNADKKRSEILLSPVPTYQGNYWNGNSWYTVLCLPYNVRVSEYSLAKTFPVDCTRAGTCRNLIPLIATLKVDLECEGYNNQPALMPAIHSGDSMQLFDPAPYWDRYPGIGFDITLRDANNVQFRGKRSKLFLPNCTFDRWAWSSATCLDCGYRQNYFSVLTVPGIRVQTVELPYNDRPLQYPDTRQYPVVIQTADCSVGTACQTNIYETFSRINVKSARGAPGDAINGLYPFVVVKFGNVTQQGLRLIHQSWVYTDGRNNAICVLADRRNEYSLNWGAFWAANNAGQLFADCSSVSSTQIDNCRVPAQPPITGSGTDNGFTGTSPGGGNPSGGNFIIVAPAKK